MGTRRRGPQAKDPAERLRNRVALNFNDAEYAQLDALAAEAGLSASQYLRQLAIDHLARKRRKR